jgi:hypothetical protein
MVTDQDVNIIMNLSCGEKPEKRIREFLNELLINKRDKELRIEFFNKTYKAFFSTYFSKFAGRYKEECIQEAYIHSLGMLVNNCSLEAALQEGIRAANKIHRSLRGYDEITTGGIQY